ncbi:hypothetical protein CRUP_010989 [Coryphaenoides rupestris]|nr:hypothetical protein CRUP_010989 [Coryphaenoides rupestris]
MKGIKLHDLYQQGFVLAAVHPFIHPCGPESNSPQHQLYRAILVNDGAPRKPRQRVSICSDAVGGPDGSELLGAKRFVFFSLSRETAAAGRLCPGKGGGGLALTSGQGARGLAGPPGVLGG